MNVRTHPIEQDFPVCLTVGGSDSSGGAGIQADLKTFAALGTYGASAITALTAQNTVGVQGVVAVDAAFVRLQIDAVCDDLPVAAAKTGMLVDANIIAAVADAFSARPGLPLVVDPVLVARGGDALTDRSAIDVLRERLLPMAAVITPNRFELVLLAGHEPYAIEDALQLRRAARALFERVGRPVLAKGGAALPGALDLLIDADGREHPFTIADGPIATRSTHGAGCTLSAALTALLARGHRLVDAVGEAKQFVAGAIRHALPLGSAGGHGPIHHSWLVHPRPREADETGL